MYHCIIYLLQLYNNTHSNQTTNEQNGGFLMNILILTGRFGMGHYSAAASLAESIKEKYPLATITLTDIFEYISPMHYKKFYSLFTFLVNHGSKFYNSFYSFTEKQSENGHPPFLLLLYKVLEQLLMQTYPDVIISTLPLCCQLISRYKRHHDLHAPLITCITDISTHNEWVNENTDYYLVGAPSMKYDLMQKGVDAERIYVSGIPVKKAFKHIPQKKNTEQKHLLIMGGGLGLIPNSDDFYEKLNGTPGLKTTIILGNNRKKYRELFGKYENIEIVGFTNQVYRYMYEADLLLSKPGGITTFEAIFAKLPMMVLCPFLQQETKNARFIQKEGFGRILWNSSADVAQEVTELIFDQSRLFEMKEMMKHFRDHLQDQSILTILERLSHHTSHRQPAGDPFILPKGSVSVL